MLLDLFSSQLGLYSLSVNTCFIMVYDFEFFGICIKSFWFYKCVVLPVC